MKCVCRKRCQVRRDVDGKIVFFAKGDVENFVVCPTHFEPIEGEDAVALNFDNAQEQELLESEFDLDSLKDYIREKYDRNPSNRGKEKTIEFLLDCRFRSLSEADLKGVL